MKTLSAILAVATFAAAPMLGVAKDAPLRAPQKGCQWEKINDATLGLDVWVQRCDFGFRRINLYAKDNALMLHYSDGGEDEKLIETFALQADEKPEAAIQRVFAEHTADKDLVAHCLVKPYKGYAATPKGAKRYTVLPNAALKKEWEKKTDPGDIPEPPCGDWGDMPDSVQYYEAQQGAGRVMIVRAGQDEPLFDEKTVRLLLPTSPRP
jgi:hypothetical protein